MLFSDSIHGRLPIDDHFYFDEKEKTEELRISLCHVYLLIMTM